MFGTLRYLPEKKTAEFLERESGATKPQHSACDNCRVKKIRCSGRKAGCSRCKTLSLPCSYTHAPARKGKRKQAPGSSDKDQDKNKNGNERGICPGFGGARDTAYTATAAAPAAEPPSLLTMEPHGGDKNYTGLDKDVSTWSSCLNWSPDEGIFVPDSDYAADFFISNPGHINTPRCSSQLETPAQQPLVSNSSTPPDLLPTPPLTHILAPTVSTTRSSEDIPEIATDRQSSCSCLNSAVFLLDELESPHHDGAPGEQGLDSILSIYQEVLFLCKRMINCASCRGKSENMMVLSMVLERLTILCGEVIDAFIAQRDANGPGAPPIPPAMMERQPLALGEYEIDGGDYEVMMGVLVTRRLLELEAFLARMKRISSLTRRAHQQARMARVDQHIKDLFRKLTAVCPLVTVLRVDPNAPMATEPGKNISSEYTGMG
ncbi:hypothetical protein BDW62DRAFT_54836 [Aspergillus aurantiobrunneus]